MELRSEGWLISKNKEGKRGNIWKLDVRSHMTARHVTTGEKSPPQYLYDFRLGSGGFRLGFRLGEGSFR